MNLPKPNRFDVDLIRDLLTKQILTPAQVKEAMKSWSLTKESNPKVLLEDILVDNKFIDAHKMADVKNVILTSGDYRDILSPAQFRIGGDTTFADETIVSNLDYGDMPGLEEKNEATKIFPAEENSLAYDEDDLEKIKNIPDFELEMFLGKGSVGTSFKGHNRKTGEQLIIKFLKPWLYDNKDYKQSVNSQAFDLINVKSLQIFRHFLFEENLNFYQSSFIDGESLEKYLLRLGRLKINDSLEKLKLTTEAILTLDKKNCPHLNISLKNIFICEDGSINIKGAGWNRAFFVEPEKRLDMVNGFEYLSPEFIDGKNVDIRSDIYSLGAILCHLLLSKPPYAGSDAAILKKHLVSKRPEITEIRRDVPIYLGDFIQKCMAIFPDDRFQNLNEFYEALLEIIEKRSNEEEGESESEEVVIQEESSRPNKKPINDDDPSNIDKAQKKNSNKKLIPLLFLWLQKNKFLAFSLALISLVTWAKFNLSSSKEVLNSESVQKQEEMQQELTDANNEKVKNKTVNKIIPVVEDPIVVVDEDESQEKVNVIVPPKKPILDTFMADKNKAEKIIKNLTANDKNLEFKKREKKLISVRELLIVKEEMERGRAHRFVQPHLDSIINERTSYWLKQKVILNEAINRGDKNEIKKIIQSMKNETSNDPIIERNTNQFVLRKRGGEPLHKDDLYLNEKAKIKKAEIDRKTRHLANEHKYFELYKYYTNLQTEEKNPIQKEIYFNEAEIYEQAEKVKSFIQGFPINKKIYIRSLGLDKNGIVEAVSSKGIHTKNRGADNLIAWKDVSSKILASLASTLKPRSLGDNIALLVYAKRASNHLAIQRSLYNIEKEFSFAMETPRIKEIKDSLSDVDDLLKEDWMELQISLMEKVIANGEPGYRAEIKKLFGNLQSEYYSNPVWKKYKPKLDLIKKRF